MPAPTPDVDLFAAVRARLPPEERPAFERYLAGLFALPEAMTLDEETLSRRYGAFRDRYARAAGTPPVENDGDAGGFMSVAIYASLGRRHDWSRALGQIRAPTVALHGDRDLSPVDGVRALAAAIPGASVRVVQGGHFLLDEAPTEVEQAVRDVAQGA
jgi:proline iminopeptidase